MHHKGSSPTQRRFAPHERRLIENYNRRWPGVDITDERKLARELAEVRRRPDSVPASAVVVAAATLPLVRMVRPRGAGRPKVRRGHSRASATRGDPDSDSDGPGEAGPRLTIVPPPAAVLMFGRGAS